MTTLNESPKPRADRRGAIERGLANRDLDLFLQGVKERTVLEGDCWIWTGARTELGYPVSGRANTRRLIHRAVCWAKEGFIGEMKTSPPAAHACGRRLCCSPLHLFPATAHLNSLESLVRKTLVDRIRALQEVIRLSDPEHPILAWPELRDSPRNPVRHLGVFDERPRERVRRLKQTSGNDARLLAIRNKRFQQVVDVRQRIANGASLYEAMAAEGISRSIFDDWKARLDVWLATGEIQTGASAP